MLIMQQFGQASGLKINTSKSSVVPIWCSHINLDDILHDFDGMRATLPMSHLGLTITIGRLWLNHLQQILDRAASKMAGWQGNLMNIGGRRELVKSVLSSLPTYFLTAIRPPQGFYMELDKLRRKFLWAGNLRLHGGKCKVSWPRVCHPLSRGGLGIHNLEAFGRSLRLRWLWHQWKSPGKPWSGSELPIDEVDEALFAVATRVTVCNGKHALFWKSSWLNGRAPALIFPALYTHSRRKNRMVANAMENENWIRDLMHDLHPTLFIEYMQLWLLIDEFNFNHNDTEEDDITWTRTASGKYSAKSAYNMHFDGSLESSFPTEIWQVCPPPPSKCKVFTWLMIQGRIWTADRLLLCQWPNEYFCPLCQRNRETVTHLFIECPVSCRVWSQISFWVSMPTLSLQQWKPDALPSSWFSDLSAVSSRRSKGMRSLIVSRSFRLH
jgi:hypothetical protein